MVTSTPTLDYLWLELTNVCNERCSHCYNSSGPDRRSHRTLSEAEWIRVISEAARLNTRHLQFIGGEPTLVRGLVDLLVHASRSGFSSIEVFTNATNMPLRLVSVLREADIAVATSLYSHVAERHDAFTKLPGSHARTVNSLRRLLDAGVRLRVAIIDIDADASHIDATERFVRNLGIENVSIDRVRGFGRGEDLVAGISNRKVNELCGRCWMNKMCILPDGTVVPCVMSRTVKLGAIQNTSLADLLLSPRYRHFQDDVYENVWKPMERQQRDSKAGCNPDRHCSPDERCGPTDGGTVCGGP